MSRDPRSRRALRRHHEARRFAWARRALAYRLPEPSSIDDHELELRRWARSPKACSCWMCGNPRRFGAGPSWQERRAWTVADFVADLEVEDGSAGGSR